MANNKTNQNPNTIEEIYYLNGEEKVYRETTLDWSRFIHLLDELGLEYSADMDGQDKNAIYKELAKALGVSKVKVLYEDKPQEPQKSEV